MRRSQADSTNRSLVAFGKLQHIHLHRSPIPMRSYGGGKKNGLTSIASITWGKPMADTPTTEPRPAASMAAQVTGEGPMALTTPEANALRAVIKKLLGQVTELQRLNSMMAHALAGKRLQVVHQEHEDGTISFDLEPAPDPAADAPETIN